ncbi:MAG: PfkB family carbohydrate kinase [Planctomycetota bacterium]|nr:PfkB family carbohydrate kinase [Planctomycetota bacterium]
MTLLVVGSTAFDTVETPHGEARDCLGGSSTYFSLAARMFTPVRLVSVVGEDFPDEHRAMLEAHDIDLAGLEKKVGKTFRWHGRYSADMNQRDTIDVQLNTFGDFAPDVPEAYKDSEFVFLANGAPSTQMSVLDQVEKPQLVVADTMDLWIETQRDELGALLRRVSGIIVNDEEAKQLTGESNLIRAGRSILEMGPSLAIVKKGEHGSFLFGPDFQYALPAYPTENVLDPTGAGDSFAGGFMGYLAGCDSISLSNMKRAVGIGTVTASLTVESFGTDGLVNVDRSAVDRRYEELVQFIS